MSQSRLMPNIILLVLLAHLQAIAETDFHAPHPKTVLLSEDHLICKSSTIVLPGEGFITKPAHYFVATGIGFKDVQIRRAEMNNFSCDIESSNEFSNKASFCCNDIGNEVFVEARGINAKGDEKFCMIKVKLVLGASTAISQCVPNIVIPCSSPINLSNLSNFGRLAQSESTRRAIVVNGIELGRDGLMGTKCENVGADGPIDLDISEDYELIDTLGCGASYEIIRTFKIKDRNGILSNCQQQIIVKADPNELQYDDIIWPSDTTLIGCLDAVNLEIDTLGQPVIPAGFCLNTLMSSEDVSLNSDRAGCAKVIRTWKIIDWCQYNANGTRQLDEGVWTHKQVILIESNILPTINNCEDIDLCANEDSCTARFQFTIEAQDDCFEAEDLQYNYELYPHGEDANRRSGRSRTVDEILPIGQHVLNWSVSDGCNNIQSCTHLITVSDCKSPQIVCINGFTGAITDINLNEQPILEIWASDFTKEIDDNCTPYDELIISFSKDSIQPVIYFGCDMLGENAIEIFVFDGNENYSSCVTTFTISDNINVCQIGLSAQIEGQIKTEAGAPVNNVAVSIESNYMSDKELVNDNGTYSFENLGVNFNYYIKPEKDAEAIQGLSTLDLVLLQQHIIGKRILQSPYRLIAGDINNSENISASDLVELKQLLLGATDHFISNESWKFIDADYRFINKENPWPFSEGYYVNTLPSQGMLKDFIGIKIGDIDGSIGNSAESRSSTSVNAQMEDAQEQTIINIPEDIDILGLDISIELNKNLPDLELYSNRLNITKNDMHYDHGTNTYQVIWHSPTSITLKENEAFISLTIPKDLIKEMNATLVTSEFEEIDLIINNHNPNHQINAYPNPFKDDVSVRVSLERDEKYRIAIYDSYGNIIHDSNHAGTKGENQINLNQTSFNSKGMYIIAINTIGGDTFVTQLVKS